MTSVVVSSLFLPHFDPDTSCIIGAKGHWWRSPHMTLSVQLLSAPCVVCACVCVRMRLCRTGSVVKPKFSAALLHPLLLPFHLKRT